MSEIELISKFEGLSGVFLGERTCIGSTQLKSQLTGEKTENVFKLIYSFFRSSQGLGADNLRFVEGLRSGANRENASGIF